MGALKTRKLKNQRARKFFMVLSEEQPADLAKHAKSSLKQA
jgi:hypothetical protein